MAVRYGELYGQEFTQEQLRANHERRLDRDRIVDWDDTEAYRNGTEMKQHFSVGWDWSRNGHYNSLYDDWVLEPSWTARKIVRSSYDRDTCVYLHVTIRGKRSNKYNRTRPYRWGAKIVFGNRGREHEQLVLAHPPYQSTTTLSIGRCKSVADALRQADKLDLDEAVRKVLAYAYSSKNAECYYREIDGEHVPWFTSLRETGGIDWRDLRRGLYIVVGHTNSHAMERTQYGQVGRYGDEDIKEVARTLGGWLPGQEEAA